MIISTLSTLLAFFPSCKKEKPAEEAMNLSEYTIVRAMRASANLAKASTAFRNRILASTSIKLTISDDWYKEGEAPADSVKEILVGSTNRAESALAKEKLDAVEDENAFIIEVLGSKIVILGKNDEVTVRALKYFATNLVKASETENFLSIDAQCRYGHDRSLRESR